MAKKTKEVKSLTHDKKKRLNIPTPETEGMMSEAEARAVSVAYKRKNNSHNNPELYKRTKDLDPQLVWRGKDEEDEHDLAVDSVPIFAQERIHPQSLIEELTRQTLKNKEERGEVPPNLFADYEGTLDLEARLEFYSHGLRWTNRMIAGDSLLVMNSLCHREDLRGKVQCIYMDPPYGINFNSNWQPSTKGEAGNRREHSSREPEQIKAYRDTWQQGIHSYLSYLRDRFAVARQLLTDTGSIFVQMGDENVHLIRSLLDEIFGSENFVGLIFFKTATSQNTKRIQRLYDCIVWYGKNSVIKYNDLYRKRTEEETKNTFNYIDSSSNKRFKLGEMKKNLTEEQIENLNSQKRIEENKYYKRYEDDFEYVKYDNVWTGTIISTFSKEKVYVVQTSRVPIERCILMTTDPGDLVLDPTCGGGTTAYVAEQWGRRWITIDTSRVSLTLARARLMGALYPNYLLRDSKEGHEKELQEGFETLQSTSFGRDVAKGFVYKRVPHVTLGDIANDRKPQEELLIDQPYEQNGVVRVTGPFTMESLSRHRIVPPEHEDSVLIDELDNEARKQGKISATRPKSIEQGEAKFIDIIFEQLRQSGINNGKKNEQLIFDELTILRQGRYLHFQGNYREKGITKRAAICVGPQYGTVSKDLLAHAAREAADFFDILIVLGFAFEGYADEGIMTLGNIPVQRAHMNNDLRMAERLKASKNDRLFVLFGEPDIALTSPTKDTIQVTIKGIDIFDPTTGNLTSSNPDDIACWFIDTDYNEEAFFVRHAYFLGMKDKDPYKRLKKALKSDINQEIWQSLYTATSRPFPTPSSGKIAVKAINRYGDEVLKIFKIP